MIKSMTAFAQETGTDRDLPLTVLLRTYNSRYLDLNLRLVGPLTVLEDRVKAAISARVPRGRVECTIQFAGPGRARNGSLAVNLDLARAYRDRLRELQEVLGLSGSIEVGLLAGLKDVLVFQEPPLSEDRLWKALQKPLKTALDNLEKMRFTEGRHLSRDLLARIRLIEKTAGQIAQRVPLVVESYQERLTKRIQKLLGEVAPDPSRLAQEVAVLADRSDISEELVRLKSHLQQLKSLLAEAQPVGRKMEFLLQEVNREINTIGSKSLDGPIAERVVTVKAELEKMREQVQNIE
ncbi:MAG: YicC family protein [Desulfobacterota bacterium]|nr:YicC family protein [Thermodesulfobacteriota bacterium]